MRSVSEVLAVLVIIAVAVSALSIVLTLITNYLKANQPRGESIDVSLVVQRNLPSGSTLGTIKATLYIMCTGPNCDQYTVQGITLYGYKRDGSKNWILATDSTTYKLQPGVTKLTILGYYDESNQQIDEVVVYTRIVGPSYQRDVYKSASVNP